MLARLFRWLTDQIHHSPCIHETIGVDCDATTAEMRRALARTVRRELVDDARQGWVTW